MKSLLFCASSLVAVSSLAAGAAYAQSPSPSAVEEVVVTGSRITTTGYTQPTPVTVVGEAQIQRDAKVSIGDSIRELPAVGSSASPNNGSGAGNIVNAITGLDTVNLRQLGINRTLVMFDGQRVVASNITGGVDLGTIPTMLVQRIDVVTAGASAAWGSDAVAGVVNLVLNKNFEGLRASIEGGESYKWDHKSIRTGLAYGKSFADGRGHVIVAGNYLNSPDVVFPGQRSWYRTAQLVNNPRYTATNAEPRLMRADNVGLSQATQGGLITGGPLRGIQFVGPNGTPTPFNFGNVSGPLSNGGDAELIHPSISSLTVQYRTKTLFGFGSWELSDNLKASLQLNYGTTWSRNNSVPAVRFGNVNIPVDNAYLPASVRTQMQTLGLATIPVGTTNMNNIDPNNLSLDNFENALGIPVNVTRRALKRGVFSLDGKIGDDWTWNAYYQKGQVKVRLNTRSNVINGNYAKAVDAVRNSAGQIVCRVNADANPANDDPACVPLNIFGTGVASAEAIRYINVKPGQNWEVITLDQDVGAFSAQGTLPFGFQAGQIAVAFGAEYRREKGEVEADAGASARLYSVANFTPFAGKYNVKEAFLELDVPILEDTVVNSLSFNAAGRVTDYSTSGVVATWKLGLTSDINDSIRVRGTLSRDIRAPNLSELFDRGATVLGSAVDPRTGQNVQIYNVASGNTNLKPEEADTFSVGAVLRPAFLPRASLSVDYYSIDIQKAIFRVGGAQVLARCNAGQTLYCSQLGFDPVTNILSQITTYPLNVSSQKASGIDFQADYSMPLFEGDLSFRVLGNYILKQTQEEGGVVIDYRGAIGSDSAVGGVPKMRGTASATYAQGPLSLTAQVRYIHSARLNNAWTAKDVDDNTVPALGYLDLRGSYNVREGIQVFAAIDNLTNVDPPLVPASPAMGQSAYYFAAISGTIYDTLGRQYRAGIRFSF